jgi:hypothetical protein
MKIGHLLLVGTALALLACQNTTGTAPVPSCGSAGAMGEGYCDSAPSNPDDYDQWMKLCEQNGR